MRGAKEIVKEVLASLDLTTEGDTRDNLITVKYNTCLGACAQAPVISVDHQLMGKVTPEQVRECIEALRSGPENGDEADNGATNE